MYNHDPENYKCPICITINGIENEDTMIKQDDIVYRDDIVMAFISSKFVGNNPGHVLVAPIKHYENLYDLPEEEVNRIMKIAKKMAFAIKKVRNCDGNAKQ
jgi:histidine triad (HIT) family protein